MSSKQLQHLRLGEHYRRAIVWARGQRHLLCSRHHRQAIFEKPQQYGCSNKICITNTPVDIPTQMGAMSQDPTPWWGPTGNQRLLRENLFSPVKILDRLCILQWPALNTTLKELRREGRGEERERDIKTIIIKDKVMGGFGQVGRVEGKRGRGRNKVNTVIFMCKILKNLKKRIQPPSYTLSWIYWVYCITTGLW